MTSLPYASPDTTGQMHADCRACQHEMGSHAKPAISTDPAPSIDYADFTQDAPKREIEISEAAARLAAKMHLHLH